MLIVAGGITYGSKAIDSTEIMSFHPPSTMTWTQSHPLPQNMRDGLLVNLNNHIFLFPGKMGPAPVGCDGCLNYKVYEYDSSSHRWIEHEKGTEYARYEHAASVVKMKDICPK